MTHEILQVDIDLARKLLQGASQDSEIVTALARRGIESSRAAQLVADLRAGKPVAPQLEIAPEGGLPLAELENAEGAASRRRPSQQKHSRRDQSRAGTGSRIWLWLAVAVILGLAGAVFVAANQRYRWFDLKLKLGTKLEPARAEVLPALNAPADEPGVAPPAELQLEMRADGLHLGEALVTRETALETLSQVLGVPTRTNQDAGPGKITYTYDHHGLLLYVQKGAGDGRIVLDYDALGGAHGAASPFRGKLSLNEQIIRAETDAKTLAAMKQLGLSHSGEETGGIFAGQLQNVGFYFAYLRSPKRLSLVEIDLK